MKFLKLYNKCFYLPLFAILLFSSCSKDDESSVEKNLLLGQWFEVEKCQEQNYLILKNDDTYTWRQSGNTSCEENTMPTVETTGTFSLSNNGIFFEINDSEIIENPSGNPVESSLPRPISASRIISLTENYFEFELTYEGSEPETFQRINYRFEKP